jgi:4-hydroxy-tetrahydrodipicolinate synthase
MDIPISVYKRLAQVPNIIGVKEASMSISKIARVIQETGADFVVWSGNDDMTVPVISLGGQGVISVISNLYPEKVAAMTDAALDGDFDTAAALQTELLELCDLMFSEVNPIPVKAALKCMGYDCGGCRLPLTAPGKETLQKIRSYFG